MIQLDYDGIDGVLVPPYRNDERAPGIPSPPASAPVPRSMATEAPPKTSKPAALHNRGLGAVRKSDQSEHNRPRLYRSAWAFAGGGLVMLAVVTGAGLLWWFDASLRQSASRNSASTGLVNTQPNNMRPRNMNPGNMKLAESAAVNVAGDRNPGELRRPMDAVDLITHPNASIASQNTGTRTDPPTRQRNLHSESNPPTVPALSSDRSVALPEAAARPDSPNRLASEATSYSSESLIGEEGMPASASAPSAREMHGRAANPDSPSGAVTDNPGATWTLQFPFNTTHIPPAKLRGAMQGAERCAGTLVITGHTCIVGAPETNHRVGLARARSIGAALERRGVSAARIALVSVGSAQPVATNATREGRIKNRRVVIECRPN